MSFPLSQGRRNRIRSSSLPHCGRGLPRRQRDRRSRRVEQEHMAGVDDVDQRGMPRPTGLPSSGLLGPAMVRDRAEQLRLRGLHHRLTVELHRHGDRGPGHQRAQPGRPARDPRDRIRDLAAQASPLCPSLDQHLRVRRRHSRPAGRRRPDEQQPIGVPNVLVHHSRSIWPLDPRRRPPLPPARARAPAEIHDAGEARTA